MANESTVVRPDPATTPSVTRQPGWRVAVLFALGYFLIGLAWLGSNPPGAAPDEHDHLTKALGIARLDIGKEYTGPPQAQNPVGRRNASISRVVEVPAHLNPEGYRCMARDSTKTADCLPTTTPPATGMVERITPVGAYPPFIYLPSGLAAYIADSPTGAFLAARLVFLLIATAFLFVGAWHLVRGLGPASLLGAFVGLTPVAVFSTSVVSTSGVEISSAFAVAAVAVVAIRRPESLAAPATEALLAVAGATLALSRQLGAVTLVVLLLVVAVRLGWGRIVALLREHFPVFTALLLVLSTATVAVLFWELQYDHPSNTGTPFSWQALREFDPRLLNAVRSGVGVFGWLDSPMPHVAMALWIMAVVVICGMGLLLARRADHWTLVGVIAVAVVVAYVAYAIIFFPIGASLQGRHMLPLFGFVPLLAGVIVVERLAERGLHEAVFRLFLATGVVLPALHLVAVWFNSRRYAVGADGPVLFLGRSLWAPAGGWVPWLLVGAAGAALLGLVAVRSRPEGFRAPLAEVEEHVER